MKYRCQYQLSDMVITGAATGASDGEFDDANHGTTVRFSGKTLPRAGEKIYDDTLGAEKLDPNPVYGAQLVLTTPATDSDGDGIPDIAADNVATATVNIQKKDKDGNDMTSPGDNETVFLETLGGTLNVASVALVNGAASCTLAAGTAVGRLVTVIGRALEFDRGSIQIKYV